MTKEAIEKAIGFHDYIGKMFYSIELTTGGWLICDKIEIVGCTQINLYNKSQYGQMPLGYLKFESVKTIDAKREGYTYG